MHVLWQLYNWWLPSLTRCFPVLVQPAQREDRPLSVSTHTQQRHSGSEHFLVLWSRRQQTVLQYKQKLCWEAALEVPAGVNVKFKPVLNMTHTFTIFSGKRSYHTEGCVQRNSLFLFYLSPSFPLSFYSLDFSSSAVCASALRVLLEGVQKDTVWNEHSSDLPDTPDTANQITFPRHIGHCNWLVGGKYDQWGFEWREKRGGESEEEGGRGAREWCYGSSMHFNRPFGQDGTGNLRNKSELSSPPDRLPLNKAALSWLANRPILEGGSLL